jgi:hypothetical protein
MKIEIRNKCGGNRATVGEFNNIRHELVRALAAYLIDNDLVKIELHRGNMIVTVDVKSIRDKQFGENK